MCRMANCLLSHGVGRGDRVAIYMPTSPDAVAAILACARIGALHSVVFAGEFHLGFIFISYESR